MLRMAASASEMVSWQLARQHIAFFPLGLVVRLFLEQMILWTAAF
jgi:hypothetical protein